MRLGRFRFRPGLIPTLATLVTFPVLVALGFWQLDRAEQRQALIDAYEARDAGEPVALHRDSGLPADVPRNARARGVYDGERQFLLDNQMHQRETGYHVLTPLRLEGRQVAVLVDRGWVPLGDSRAELPEVPAPGGEQSIDGHIDRGPPTGIRLGGMADGESGWPLRIQYIDYDELESRLGYRLLPIVFRLDPEAEEGYAREWGPMFREGFGPERNHGYAVQWFGLATALLVIYLGVNLKRVGDDDRH